jgi:uncharacterized protein DUF3489
VLQARSVDVTAVITAEGENMNTSTTEETATSPAQATEGQPKATKNARVAQLGAHVAKKKGKSGKKATPAKKAPKGAKKARSAREGSKTNQVLELLKRPGGVTAKELMKVTGWQPHSVRGFLSGTVGKKMGLTVTPPRARTGSAATPSKPKPSPFRSPRAAGKQTGGVARFSR